LISKENHLPENVVRTTDYRTQLKNATLKSELGVEFKNTCYRGLTFWIFFTTDSDQNIIKLFLDNTGIVNI
jgi:hypothetical protein